MPDQKREKLDVRMPLNKAAFAGCVRLNLLAMITPDTDGYNEDGLRYRLQVVQ
jgi:hypothetical protein